ncbi:hypothetical protein [Devosia enhydra]|nr:hypothetical protein [Devosia enhydra]
MLELILALMNEPTYQDKDVTDLVCPSFFSAALSELYQALEGRAPQLEVYYNVQDGYQILSVERHRPLALYTDELRILISTSDASCQALVFRKTL